MSRAEERALEAYPKSEKYTTSQRLIVNDLRDGFIQGYKQAEKDTIERVAAWLEDNAEEYIHDRTMFNGKIEFYKDWLIMDIRKAMKE